MSVHVTIAQGYNCCIYVLYVNISVRNDVFVFVSVILLVLQKSWKVRKFDGNWHVTAMVKADKL